MSNDSIVPQVFDFNGNPLRATVDENGNPLISAPDACKQLGILNVSQAVSRLDDDEKVILYSDSRAGINIEYKTYSTESNKPTIFVTESGLYNLILRSDKPEAKAFKRWITHDVLPAIRKTGSYGSSSAALDQLTRYNELLEQQLAKYHEAELEAKRLLASRTPAERLFDSPISRQDHARAIEIVDDMLKKHGLEVPPYDE